MLDEVLVLEGDAFELKGDVQQRVAPSHLEYLIGGLLDDLRAGIIVLVDPMSEAHETALAGLHALHELRDPLPVTDLGEHPEYGFVGAAVQRPVQRCRGRRRGGERVRV